MKSQSYKHKLNKRLFFYFPEGQKWTYGTCITEFSRKCTSNKYKEFDLNSRLQDVYVQDTDLAYRPRIRYTDKRVLPQGT